MMIFRACVLPGCRVSGITVRPFARRGFRRMRGSPTSGALERTHACSGAAFSSGQCPRLRRHRRRALPRGQTAERIRRTGLRHLSRSRSRRHHDRRREPPGRRDIAAGPRRRARRWRGVARDHRQVARSGPRLDVPARAEPDGGPECPVAGSLMYRSGLVPRVIPTMGLIGAPLLIAATTATLFGYIDQFSAWSVIATLPVAMWELSVGVWMVVKGFKPSPITAIAIPADAGRPSVPVAWEPARIF
jgi:hypothetical protein